LPASYTKTMPRVLQRMPEELERDRKGMPAGRRTLP
jgi:hypothetical protein